VTQKVSRRLSSEVSREPVMCVYYKEAPACDHERVRSESRRATGLVGSETLIHEYLNLPLKDTVKEKWLSQNATHVFGLE